MTEDTPMVEIEIYIVVDEDGDYELGKEQDEATERYDENISSLQAKHVIKMTVQVPAPRIIEVAAALPATQDGSYSLEIKA